MPDLDVGNGSFARLDTLQPITQMVGLEADEQGRELLKQLCDVVEYYYQIGHTETPWRDIPED